MDVLSVIELPLWTIPAAVIVLCFLPDVSRLVRGRRRARRSEARRLAALDALWLDEVGVAPDRPSAGRDSFFPGAAPAFPRVVRMNAGLPREIVYARTGEPKDAA